jgi:hypothetical protein
MAERSRLMSANEVEGGLRRTGARLEAGVHGIQHHGLLRVDVRPAPSCRSSSRASPKSLVPELTSPIENRNCGAPAQGAEPAGRRRCMLDGHVASP